MIGYEDQAKLRRSSLSAAETTLERYNRPGYHGAKRLMDVVLSTIGLIVFSPVFLAVTIAVALSTGWPVTFKQRRVGQYGKLFSIIKFRSMVKNAEEILRSRPDLMEEYKQNFKIENDPRISKVGAFLRKTSLDEIPQLFNVLKGEMTLVGPRPIVEPELAKYGDHQEMYLSMKPGCTGLWQCSGRSDTTYEERIALDREYCENASVWFDLQILFKTVFAIVARKGAR